MNANLNHANLANSNLTYVNLSKAKLNFTNLENADLSNSINNQRKPLKGHSREVTSVTFSKDDKYIISGSADNSIKIWD